MARVSVVSAAIWCRITATALAAALAASPLYAAEPEKTVKRAGKFVEKTARRAVKFTKKTAEKSANWVKRQTE